MGFVYLVLAILLSPPAHALDEDAPDLEIVVTAERKVTAARAALDDAIRDLGYARGVHVGEKTVYPRKKPWQPRVVVWDEGFTKVKARRIVPMTVRPGGGMAVVDGVFSSTRTVRRSEARVLDALTPSLRTWQDALADRGLALRVVEVQGDLNRAWIDGMTDAADRRAAIVEMWLHTSDTDAGEKIREVIEAFIDEVVQPSGHPFTEAEVQGANARRTFERTLEPITP